MVPHPADALIGISLSSFIAGERSFATLFEPGDRRSLQSFFWNNGKLIIFYLVPRFDMFTPDRQEWTRRVLDTVPAEGTVHLRSLDAEHHETNGEVLVSAQDPIKPRKLLLLDLNAAAPLGAPVILKRNPENFDASGLVVTRHEAVSTGGEMIPYTQVGPANGNRDAPVHLTAYGGYGISLLPHWGRHREWRQALSALLGPMLSYQCGVDIFQVCLQLRIFLDHKREQLPPPIRQRPICSDTLEQRFDLHILWRRSAHILSDSCGSHWRVACDCGSACRTGQPAGMPATL
ncbi:hypothetical protein NKI41_29140 [Mesorhizobium sp. M0601]|uniref:hypothetical protein n=1 Tax=Mesorhizobium sp. M0601 TaxID=2956969 RepID=UPI00333A7C07